MGNVWKYALALLLGGWFVICNQYANVSVAYNTNATYNYRASIIRKHSHFSAAPLRLTQGKDTRQVHNTMKRWLKETEPFTFFVPISFSITVVAEIHEQQFSVLEESFLCSTHRLTSPRGPPQA
jgi:hypothetical protein